MLIKATFSTTLAKQQLLWQHQSELSLFLPFLFSWKVDHTIDPDSLRLASTKGSISLHCEIYQRYCHLNLQQKQPSSA